MAKENPSKYQLEDRLKAVQPVIASHGDHYLPMTLVGSQNMSGRVKEEERKGGKVSTKDRFSLKFIEHRCKKILKINNFNNNKERVFLSYCTLSDVWKVVIFSRHFER